MAIDERLMKHARGAMIGLAIGDALGMPTQSMSAEQIIECYGGPVRRLMDAVPQQPIAPNMKAGSVTDDTEQAFVLAARLIEDHGRIDNDAYAQDLLRWEAKMKEKGSLDLLGPSTKAALQALAEGSTRSLPDDSAPRTEAPCAPPRSASPSFPETPWPRRPGVPAW